jgi:GTP-binding protein
MSNLVAIVGRPNVGKSTLFNRLTETRDAIVDPESGVTRDRKYGSVEWCGKHFNIIDTGGYITNSEDRFEQEIRDQVNISIDEANLILFLVDVTTGITDVDQDIVSILRRSTKKVMLVANKVDTSMREQNAYEFYSLGLDEKIYKISANNGYGTGELLDDVVANLPDTPLDDDLGLPKIAVVGRPNVGKSTFINTILGEERNIVTDIAGTTRDSVDTHYKAFGFDFMITDTAGLRKKKRVDDSIEYYSTVRTIRAISSSDVCVQLIDAEEGMNKQDIAIFYQIVEEGKGVVLAVNKWDLIEKDDRTSEKIRKQIEDKIAPFVDVPIIFTSNVKKTRILKALELSLEVYGRRDQKVPTSKLNDVLLDYIEEYPPPSNKGKFIRIKYITQVQKAPPVIVFFCNLPQYIKAPYKRYLENKIRENFDFSGVPLKLFFRKK